MRATDLLAHYLPAPASPEAPPYDWRADARYLQFRLIIIDLMHTWHDRAESDYRTRLLCPTGRPGCQSRRAG